MHNETKTELNNECKDDMRGFIYRDDARWENENEKNNGDNEEGKGISERDNNKDGSLAY